MNNAPREFRLAIARIILSVVRDGDGWDLKRPRDIRFYADRAIPDVTFTAHYGALPKVSLDQPAFCSGGNWSLYRDDSEWIFSLQSKVTGPEPYALAVVDGEFTAGDVYLRELEGSPRSISAPPTIDPLEYPLDEVLTVHLLSQGRGVLVHACGVSHEGRGVLFCGVSGAGKSTMANLWKQVTGATVLSDDRIIVRKTGSRFRMYGTPWHGDAGLCAPDSVPLHRIFFLRHAEHNAVDAIQPTDALSRLIVRSFPTFWDKEGMAYTMGLCAEIAQTVPCCELGFLPDERVLSLVV